MIIPKIVREYLYSRPSDGKTVGGILSLLSIFRVFPTHVKPKYDTISDAFSGSARSIDLCKLKLALDDFLLNKTVSKRMKIKLIGGESAGPNGFKAL
jgi:hypothetical protein